MRLDQRLVELGLAPSRARARDLVKRGFVKVAGDPCDKPGREVTETAMIEVACDTPQYVSRGAEKLLAALDHFHLDPSNATALDVGASTGGFTEVLLERGARKVYAVDVGTRQLHLKLKSDHRVVSLENRDIRALTENDISEPIDAIVADLSFISLTKALATPLSFAAPKAWLVALIKPQFEVGPGRVGRGGIVRDEQARNDAVKDVEHWLSQQPGWTIIGSAPSPISGGSGNIEYLIAAERHG